MEILLGSLAGIPMATSVWLMLSRNLVKFLLGLVLIGNVANLVIFASGGLTYGAPPLIAEGVTAPAEPVANPLPQALILTAFVIGCGLAGTLNMADLHGRLGHLEDQELLSAVAVVFLIAFGIKAAVFPLFFWLPASYHTPPIAVSAIFAGLMTKIGVYALICTFTLIFPAGIGLVTEILFPAALLSMIVGVLGAIAQTDIRRILTFQVIASIGFLILGMAFGSTLAMTAAVFYMVHAILPKTQLFMILGLIGREAGGFDLADLGGLYKNRPGLAIIFLIGALARMDIPPLTGIWPKVMIIETGLELGATLAIAVVLVYSLLTFIPLMRIWSHAFWSPGTPGSVDLDLGVRRTERRLLTLPAAGLAVAILAIGLMPEPLLRIAEGPTRCSPSDLSHIVRLMSCGRALPTRRAPRRCRMWRALASACSAARV